MATVSKTTTLGKMAVRRTLIDTWQRGGDTGRRVTRLAVIGLLNTVNYFVLFNIFRQFDFALIASVTLAFALATFVSYVLNRRWTFGLEDNAGGLSETIRFYLVNAAAWAVTVAFITICDRLFGPLQRVGENLASLAAAGVTLLPKFVSYRDLVFGKAIAAAKPDVRDEASTRSGI